jgi:hypothetical protein
MGRSLAILFGVAGGGVSFVSAFSGPARDLAAAGALWLLTLVYATLTGRKSWL